MSKATSDLPFGLQSDRPQDVDLAVALTVGRCREVITAMQWDEAFGTAAAELAAQLCKWALSENEIAQLRACEKSLISGANADGAIALPRFFKQSSTFSVPFLHVATIAGHVPLVRLLLKHGASLDAIDSEERTALHHAALGGQVELVRSFLRAGADTLKQDAKGATPLHYAALESKTICKLLLKGGASPRIVDIHGRAPLHYAAVAGIAEEIPSGFLSEADVFHADLDGRTALHEAAQYGHPELCRRLLARGGDVNATDKSGLTPLHGAATWGDITVCAALLNAGADPNALDANGLTPFHCVAVFATEVAIGDENRLATFSQALKQLLIAGANPLIKRQDTGQTVADMLKTTPKAWSAYRRVIVQITIMTRAIRPTKAPNQSEPGQRKPGI